MKAFPHTYKHATSGLFIEEQGMELRDYFAAQALIGCVAKYKTLPVMAINAYKIADAMLKQREQTTDE
jgi:hypothetical protein